MAEEEERRDEPSEQSKAEDDNDDAFSSSSSSEDEESDESDYSDYEDGDAASGAGGSGEAAEKEDDNTPEKNIRMFEEAVESPAVKRRLEEDERNYVYHEDLFDFPRDPERWREEDLRELWADAPLEFTKPGWDPVWADEEDWEVMKEEAKAGRDPPIAPFYLPYRKPFPAIPDNHYDISNPKAVIEELDRIEEFLKWVSYVFADGSS